MKIHIGIEDSKFVREVLERRETPKPRNGQAITLMWSGGLDSTYLLLWLLCNGYTVHTIYVALNNNINKTTREKEARRGILQWLNRNYPNLSMNVIEHTEPVCEVRFFESKVRSDLSQVPAWIMGLQALDQYCNIPCDYALSYVNGDDAIYYIPMIKKTVAAMSHLTEHTQHRARVHFPLERIKKQWFAKDLPTEIHELITYCEFKGEEDCSCPACKRHKQDVLGE